MTGLDERLIAPARLQLAVMLSPVTEAEFGTIREVLAVSDSVLSKHLGLLEAAGYVRRRKDVLGDRRTTWVALTGDGQRALAAHVAALRELIAVSERAPSRGRPAGSAPSRRPGRG